MCPNSQLASYLEFLRYAVGSTVAVPSSVREMNWDGLYEFAVRQAVVGVMFRGIEKLPEELVPRGCRAIYLWGAAVASIRARNRELDKMCDEITDLFRRDGFQTTILKGQGMARLYPSPDLRMSGDIDIWVMKAETPERYPHRREIVRYIKEKGLQRSQGKGMSYVHTSFHQKAHGNGGVIVEVHATPAILFPLPANRRLQKWFVSHAKGEVAHQYATVEFNAVFALCHMYRHFFDSGIGMRQFVDYYYVLRQVCGRDEARRTIESLGMVQFARAVMWVMRDVLGLEEEYLLLEPDEKRGRIMLEELMKTGNMGKFDSRFGRWTNVKLLKYIKRVRYAANLVRHYPTDALWAPIGYLYFFSFRIVWRIIYDVRKALSLR